MDQDLVMWSLVVGFFTPVVVAVIQQPKWNNGARAVVTFLFCVIVGAITVSIEGRITEQRLTSSILLILVTAISTFKGLWQPSGVSPKIEEKTSLGT